MSFHNNSEQYSIVKQSNERSTPFQFMYITYIESIQYTRLSCETDQFSFPQNLVITKVAAATRRQRPSEPPGLEVRNRAEKFSLFNQHFSFQVYDPYVFYYVFYDENKNF